MSPKYESAFTQRVIETIENARLDQNMSIEELVKRSGMPRNSYFVKIRGDRTFTTEDVDKLAKALGLDPFLILRRAAVGSKEEYGLAAHDNENFEREQEQFNEGA